MKLYNTLSRSVEEFKPQATSEVSLYTCGPTVYSKMTIGNWTAYVRWDLLARTLKRYYELNWYMNITDVGHLTSDQDEGEDKLEKSAQSEHKTAWQIAETYTQDFVEGLKKLNIQIGSDRLIKATDEIDEDIKLIKQLEEKGFTYIIDDGVYFDSSKFKNYGDLARLDTEGLRAGVRVEVGQKQSPTDFALWKFSAKGQKRDMEWDSPWGKGFPGWHIECSAIAMKYLGKTIDIHTGGIDHIPIHHTNEIAQSESATNQKFVNYWLHSNFLKVNGTKISKSLSNGFTLDDIEAKGFTPLDFKMFVHQSHYQTESNFTWEGLEAAKSRLKQLKAVADLRFQLKEDSGPASQLQLIESTQLAIENALANNLNTPQALSSLSAFTHQIENDGISSSDKDVFNDFLKWLDQALGLDLTNSDDISDGQKERIKARDAARANQDWQLSDRIRDELAKDFIGLNDTPRGSFWYKL